MLPIAYQCSMFVVPAGTVGITALQAAVEIILKIGDMVCKILEFSLVRSERVSLNTEADAARKMVGKVI